MKAFTREELERREHEFLAEEASKPSTTLRYGSRQSLTEKEGA